MNMPLQLIEPDQLWTAEMPLRLLGSDIGARMTVVRLPDGSLWVHSPIALTETLKRDLDALGPVRHLVSPSSWHYQHVAEFARAYPAAKIYASPASVKRLKAVGAVHPLSDEAEPGWNRALEQALFRGSRLYDEIDFYHAATRTLVLTDLCFHIPASSSWSTRLALGPLGIVGRFSPSASFHWTIRDRAAVVASLQRILAWDFDRIILAHGEIVEREGRAAFRKAFGWLLGN